MGGIIYSWHIWKMVSIQKYKQFKNLWTGNVITKWADQNRPFSKEDVQRIKSYMNKFSTSVIFREMLVKTLLLGGMSVIKKNFKKASAAKDATKRAHP